MSIFVRLLGAMLFLSFAICSHGVAAEEAAASTKDAETQDSKTPAPLSKEVLAFLNSKLTLKVADMSPKLALSWQLKLADIPLEIRESKTVAAKKVSFELVEKTLAEALRTIGTKCGCQYRIVKNEIRMAMPEEWAQVDAGKASFDDLVAQEKAATAPKNDAKSDPKKESTDKTK